MAHAFSSGVLRIIVQKMSSPFIYWQFQNLLKCLYPSSQITVTITLPAGSSRSFAYFTKAAQFTALELPTKSPKCIL